MATKRDGRTQALVERYEDLIRELKAERDNYKKQASDAMRDLNNKSEEAYKLRVNERRNSELDAQVKALGLEVNRLRKLDEEHEKAAAMRASLAAKEAVAQERASLIDKLIKVLGDKAADELK